MAKILIEEGDYYRKMQSLLDNTASALGEHLDSVLIIACVKSPNNQSQCIKMVGECGNTYTHIAMAKEWVLEQDTYTQLQAQLGFKRNL